MVFQFFSKAFCKLQLFRVTKNWSFILVTLGKQISKFPSKPIITFPKFHRWVALDKSPTHQPPVAGLPHRIALVE